MENSEPASQTALQQNTDAGLSGTREQFIANMEDLVGTPYVYGGNSPADGGMDCSGSVIYALNQMGNNIPDQTASDIYNNLTTPVENGEFQPGDLRFLKKSNGDVSHVQVITGTDGTRVNATGGSENNINNPGIIARSSTNFGRSEKLKLGRINMKKKLLASILLLVVILPILAADDFLKSFFDGQNFQTIEYTIKDEKIFYSCTFTEKSREIINKGILYKKNGIEVEPLLIFDGNIVSNSEESIFTCIISTQIFYGWKIYVHAREKSFFIRADPYTNKGKNVTDGPTFAWDYKRSIFEIIEQDRSQW